MTLAVADYDHVRDLASGAVAVEGVRLTCVHHPVEEIFFRFTRHREWEVSELSLAKYSSLRAAGDGGLLRCVDHLRRLQDPGANDDASGNRLDMAWA